MKKSGKHPSANLVVLDGMHFVYAYKLHLVFTCNLRVYLYMRIPSLRMPKRDERVKFPSLPIAKLNPVLARG
jgi:hypothetical protein